MKIESTIVSNWLARPLGTMSKRELELMLLERMIADKQLPSDAAALARKARITLTKAHGYLTDLALRQEFLTNEQAISQLAALLGAAEVTNEGNTLQFSVQDAGLRLWIENALAQAQMLQGETLRRDVMKLSGRALAVLLFTGERTPNPAQAAIKLKKQFSQADWFDSFERAAKPGIPWEKVLSHVNGGASLVQIVAPFLMRLVSN